MKELNQGCEFHSNEETFSEALQAIVDYRGDVTLHLADGSCIEGFVFDFDQSNVHIFPKNGSPRSSVRRASVKKVEVTGDDASAGKSWNDWVKRRESERAKATGKSTSE